MSNKRRKHIKLSFWQLVAVLFVFYLSARIMK